MQPGITQKEEWNLSLSVSEAVHMTITFSGYKSWVKDTFLKNMIFIQPVEWMEGQFPSLKRKEYWTVKLK